MPLECRLERETNQISGLGRESCKKACFLSFATYKNSYKKWYVSDMWNFVFFILSWDVLRVVLGSSSRKPPNHLKNRANPWLKTAMAASQGMQDQISNAMSTIEDVLGNLRWGGHFLHPQKKFAHCLGGAVFFRWGGRGWGWNHRGFPTGEPSHGINLPLLSAWGIPHPHRVNSFATWPGVCRSRNARAGRWTWKIRTTLRKSAKADVFRGLNNRLGPKPFPWKIGPTQHGTSGKRFCLAEVLFFFFPKMRNHVKKKLRVVGGLLLSF